MSVKQSLLFGKLLHVQISRMLKINFYMNIQYMFCQISTKSEKTFATQIVDFNQIHF